MLHPGSVDLDCPNARLQRDRSVRPTGRLPAVNNVGIWVAYVGSHSPPPRPEFVDDGTNPC